MPFYIVRTSALVRRTYRVLANSTHHARDLIDSDDFEDNQDVETVDIDEYEEEITSIREATS